MHKVCFYRWTYYFYYRNCYLEGQDRLLCPGIPHTVHTVHFCSLYFRYTKALVMSDSRRRYCSSLFVRFQPGRGNAWTAAMFMINVTTPLVSSIVAVCLGAWWVLPWRRSRSDSILVIINLEIVQVKTRNRVKKQECLHANMHTLMKVDSSGSSTVTNLTRGSAKTHDCSSYLCSLNGSHSQSQSLDQS